MREAVMSARKRMRIYKTGLKALLFCIVSSFLVGVAISEHVEAQGATLPGPPRQSEDRGTKSGEGERPIRSAYQLEWEVQAPKIIKALEVSGRPLPKTEAEAQSLGAELTSEGYKRLDDAVLLEMLSMRVAMAGIADEKFCAATWIGSYSWDMAAAPILYLSNERQRRFAQITAAAQLAEIQNRPAKRDPPSEVETKSTVEKLFKGVGTKDGSFLLAAFKAPLDMTVRDQCRATRLFHQRLKQMAPRDALIVFRSGLYTDGGP